MPFSDLVCFVLMLVFCGLYSRYTNRRIHKAADLVRFVIFLSWRYSKRTGQNGYEKFYHQLPALDKMVYSGRPIRLNTWFSQEEIQEMMDCGQCPDSDTRKTISYGQ